MPPAPLDNDQDTRLRDYLDDKLQTLADLESLDSLLLNVRNQHSLLQQQLHDAQKDLEEAKKASVQHTTNLKTSIKAFEKDQLDIDERLRLITESDISDEAVKRFEASMDKLNRLDVAKGYVELLQLVESLRAECIASLDSSDSTSLDAYTKLRQLLLELEPLQEAADGAATHLLDHIRSTTHHLKEQIEQSFSARLDHVLKQMQWPKNAHEGIPESLHGQFSGAVSDLLKLQQPDLEAHERLNDGSRSIHPLVLLPLKTLIQPLELGFRYHFEGNNVMNRVDRPEFYLKHVAERILAKYADFMEIYIQPILSQQFRETDLSLNYVYIDATSAFITALLPMVRTKTLAILPQVLKKPSLLSHLIHELIKFDTELRDDWQYDGSSRTEAWFGLAGEILATEDTFTQWLKAEKDFALSRYNEIVEADDSFELDFDSMGTGKTKPSKAAIRMNDLLEATTDNYRELASFSYKLRFLIDIQISIFDLFYERLGEALAAYQARTSTIGRASKEDQTLLQGIEGVKRLCRIFGSADYLERAMRDWNDDVFFLELWSELQHRASAKSAQAVVAGTMTLADVAKRTSSSLSIEASTTAGEDEFEGGALFDETATAYARIRSRTENILSELLTNNVRTALNAYTKINPWSSLSPTIPAGPDGQVSTTAELDGLLQNLQTLIAYLVRAVGTVPLRKLVKQMLQEIDRVLFMNVILSHSFSGAGAAQFSVDLAAIDMVVTKLINRNMVESGLGRVHQATLLLNIPVRASRDNKDASEVDSSESEKIGLFAAGKRLFEGSGEDAKELLDEMGLDRLGVADARKVLARRVELGS